jgi:hypothetical protein
MKIEKFLNCLIHNSKPSTSATLFRPVWVLLLIALLPFLASGEITYVDATWGTTGNTFQWNGSSYIPFTPSNDQSGSDGFWRGRVEANGSSVLEAGGFLSTHTNTEDNPRLATVISGLNPGQLYKLYVYFWGAGFVGSEATWQIQAGIVDPGPGVAMTTFDQKGTGGAVQVMDDSTFTGTVLVLEKDRRLFQASLGTKVANSAGEIIVYLDDAPRPGNAHWYRTWYDGVGYEGAGPKFTLAPVAAQPGSILTFTWSGLPADSQPTLNGMSVALNDLGNGSATLSAPSANATYTLTWNGADTPLTQEFVVLGPGANSAHPIQTPVVPNASPEARALLHYLQSMQGIGILSGQTENTENSVWDSISNGGDEIAYVHRLTATDLPAEGPNVTLAGGVTATTYPADELHASGDAYARYPFSQGSHISIRWTINRSSAGPADLTFRYANNTSTRSLHLRVNGTQVASLAFPTTISSSRYRTVTHSAVPLNAGTNTIELVASADTLGPNLDRLTIGSTHYEAESATLSGGVMRWAIHEGFLGNGYITFPETQGTGVYARWQTTLSTASTAPLAIRFSNDNESEHARSLNLRINGHQTATLSFPQTGSWESYQTIFTDPVTLPAGAVTLELVASAGTAGPRIDSILHSGEIPAVCAFDFIWDSQTAYNIFNSGNVIPQRSVQRAIDWYRAGGIVTWQWHWNIPNNSDGRTTFRTDYTLDINKAFIPGTPEYNLIIGDMDIVAEALKTMRDAGVPVLWRPLHEAAGKWFWWGHIGPENYKRLWNLMFDRFTYHHGLNNLIWVNNCGYADEYAEWYPGDDTSDILGIDRYHGSYSISESDWRILADFNAPKKVPALTENGKIPDPTQLQAKGVHWSYFVTWCREFVLDGNINAPAKIAEFHKHPFVINRCDLPDWSTYRAPAVGAPYALAFSRPLTAAKIGTAPATPVAVEVVDAANRVVRTQQGSVYFWWEGEPSAFDHASTLRGTATLQPPALQRRHAGRRLFASLPPLLNGVSAPATVIAPPSELRWDRWNYSGNMGDLWGSFPSNDKSGFYAQFTSRSPDASGTLTSDSIVPSSATSGDHFLVRIAGRIVPTVTETRRFWVYADDRAELRFQLSQNSSELTRVAYNSTHQPSPGVWNQEENTQRSEPVSLVAGQPIDFEFYFVEFTGNAHAGFGWSPSTSDTVTAVPLSNMTAPAGYTFAQWLAAEGLSDPDGDADGDGLSNFLEFALGEDPRYAYQAPSSLTIASPGDNRYALPTPDGDNLILELQTASELSSTNTWTTVATWTAGPGWVLAPAAPADLSLSASPKELIDTRNLPRGFYRLNAIPANP